MNQGAKFLGISRNRLEDLETIRNYGCNIDLEILVQIAMLYNTSIGNLVGKLPDNLCSDVFVRPFRLRGKKDPN